MTSGTTEYFWGNVLTFLSLLLIPTSSETPYDYMIGNYDKVACYDSCVLGELYANALTLASWLTTFILAPALVFIQTPVIALGIYYSNQYYSDAAWTNYFSK